MPVPYREHAPAAGLARHIECWWIVQPLSGIAGYPVRPDGCLDILYSREQGLRVVGAMTAEQRYDLPAGSCMAGVRFRPGMAGRLLGVAPVELTDAVVPLAEVWGRAGSELQARLDTAASADEYSRLITPALAIPSDPLSPIQRAVEAMAAAHGDVNLDFIARQANLSPRQFRRRCLEESGLSPKHLCRILRFRRVCALVETARRAEWAAVAMEAGYFDQAHLIRDFREFTGQTPMSVFSNTGALAAG